MSDEPDKIEDLVAAIADGEPARWDAAAREAAPEDRDRIEALRDVARIADFSRGVQRVGGDETPLERWGDLLVLERIGTGTHAEVFRAWDPKLQREVALKLIRAGAGAEVLDEGRALARIRHPHVVTVYGIDARDGRVGLWMELVRGSTLEDDVRARGALDPGETRRLGQEIGAAVAAVHAAGLLHRDIKPANIVRDAQGRFVLTDFGLGTRRDGSPANPGLSGTPMYMAPELLDGGPATERSDLYAVGMVLWFAIAGRHPFEAESLDALRAASARGPQPSLAGARPGVPANLVAVIERTIAPVPTARFDSVRAMIAALDSLGPIGVVTRTPSRLAIGAVLAAIVGLAAFGLWRGRAPERQEPPAASAPAEPAAAPYAVEASFLMRRTAEATRLVTGDRVKPGDRLSLEIHATRPAWVYVLNEDEQGERYLLFPQPRFDTRNPIPADSTLVLPGTIDGKENAWIVTSAGGREYFMVVASPEPLPEIEADLGSLPAPEPGRPIEYARIGDRTVERLRGAGGIAELPSEAARPTPSRALDRFRALAGHETGVRGVWVRQIVLENPR